jgi:hypothetical protein
MGNRWGKGKEDGEERRGGRSVHKQPGTRVDRIAPHAKERFQVSNRGSGTGEGFSRQRGITKGIVPCTSDIMPTLYILCQL